MSSNAFTPSGNTVALAVTSTSTSTPLQVKGNVNNSTQRMFYNAGPNDCFVEAAATATAAVAPAAGTPGNAFPVPAGAVLVLSIPPNHYFAAISASAQTATLYITPGEGN